MLWLLHHLRNHFLSAWSLPLTGKPKEPGNEIVNKLIWKPAGGNYKGFIIISNVYVF